MEQENQAQHKRRVRYKGKYPKKFEEKYKELQPEKYQDTVQHVMKKGNTPAGMHISIMVDEILDFLKIQPGETGFDATLGYGGHTKAMLQCLEGKGHIYATDVDPEESAKTKKRLEEQGFGEDILTIRLQNFCTIDEIAKEAGALLIVDNTFMTPYFQNPLSLGADVVIHSGTKYLSGHNDTICGFLCSKDQKLAQHFRLISKTTGGTLAPFESWLCLRGLKTLALRMERHQSNALAAAEWLKKQDCVENVEIALIFSNYFKNIVDIPEKMCYKSDSPKECLSGLPLYNLVVILR